MLVLLLTFCAFNNLYKDVCVSLSKILHFFYCTIFASTINNHNFSVFFKRTILQVTKYKENIILYVCVVCMCVYNGMAGGMSIDFRRILMFLHFTSLLCRVFFGTEDV